MKKSNPLVSLYVIAYNHEAYIEQAIVAALSQTYSPLEIVISDDASTDGTWPIINRIVREYTGPHHVIVRQNSRNLGVSAHINAIWEHCHGEWIVASAGDDFSEANRVSRVMEAALSDPHVKLVQSWLNEVNENGRLIGVNRLKTGFIDQPVIYNLANRLAGDTYAPHGAAMAYSRDLVDYFGKLPNDVIFEDNIMNLRAELLGHSLVLPLPLVSHRNHAGQVTNSRDISDASEKSRKTIAKEQCNISSAYQNIRDIDKAVSDKLVAPDEFSELYGFFEFRLGYFLYRKHALASKWPSRLYYLVRVLLHRVQFAPLSRDDMAWSILPHWLYQYIKASRYN